MTQFLIYATKQICVHFFTSRQVYAHQGCNEQPDVQLESFHWKHKSQSVHDETKKNKDKPEMLSSKQNRTAYHNKKSATLKKKGTKFSKGTLRRWGDLKTESKENVWARSGDVYLQSQLRGKLS